jgi:superfamily II DNA or RNA helicase
MSTNGTLAQLGLKTDYRTGRDDPVEDFYEPCIRASNRYSRAVGYFRSSIFMITGESVIDFVKNGGKIRLVCSPELTISDIQAIEQGQKSQQEISLEKLNNEIDQMISESKENYSVNILATLIRVGALDMKIAIRESGRGIYHEKLGVFQDEEGNSVSFIGSANETFNAWHTSGNFEAIEVFCSWHGGSEGERAKRHLQDFEDIWLDLSRGIKTIGMPDALRDKLLRIAEDSIENIDLGKLRKKKVAVNAPVPKPKKIDNLLPHQINAINLWKEAGYRGIFEHATGSGKTVTALGAINEHISAGHPALVLVPSQLLLKQWIGEATEEIEGCTWLAAGAGNNGWKKNNRLKNFLSGITHDEKRIVIATMQTASTDEFLAQIPANTNLMIVGDEVHQIGSNTNSKALSISANKRLGLSATPIRYGDPEGTQKIFDYFGNVLPPVITLYDAIQSGRLVDYEYFPHIINLTAEEAEEWRKLSGDIRREIAIHSSEEGGIRLSNRAKMMLIQRSRIAKKSAVKIGLAANIIKENYTEGERWLVYCEDQEQLKDVTKAIKKIGIDPLVYYSDMEGDSEQTLKLFQMQGGVLVSIRCLDEGIDIPSISHALILASSQNPRQFIQRRGRVLRKHASKVFAAIHDAIVVPVSLDDEPEQFSLLKSELVRAHEFSSHALNRSAGEALTIIGSKLGINLDEIVTDGIEEDISDE